MREIQDTQKKIYRDNIAVRCNLAKTHPEQQSRKKIQYPTFECQIHSNKNRKMKIYMYVIYKCICDRRMTTENKCVRAKIIIRKFKVK